MKEGNRGLWENLFNEVVSDTLGGWRVRRSQQSKGWGNFSVRRNSMCKGPWLKRSWWSEENKEGLCGWSSPKNSADFFLYGGRSCFWLGLLSPSALSTACGGVISAGGCPLAAVAFSHIQSQYLPSRWSFLPSIHSSSYTNHPFILQMPTEHLLCARHIEKLEKLPVKATNYKALLHYIFCWDS